MDTRRILAASALSSLAFVLFLPLAVFVSSVLPADAAVKDCPLRLVTSPGEELRAPAELELFIGPVSSPPDNRDTVTVYYSIDGGEWMRYKTFSLGGGFHPGESGGSIRFERPGEYTIRVKCVSADGTTVTADARTVKVKGSNGFNVVLSGGTVAGMAAGGLGALGYAIYVDLVDLERLRRIGGAPSKEPIPARTGIIKRLLPEGGEVTSNYGSLRAYNTSGKFDQRLTNKFRKDRDGFIRDYKCELVQDQYNTGLQRYHCQLPNGAAVVIRPHYGMDISTPVGKPLLSGVRGQVERIHDEPRGPAGRFIEIRTSDGYLLRYLHLDKILVRQGDPITEVTSKIAETGKTGGVDPHLHLEVLDPSNRPIDPLDYFMKTHAPRGGQ